MSVAGDFNLNTFQPQITHTNNNTKLQEISNLLSEYSNHKLINRPTRLTNASVCNFIRQHLHQHTNNNRKLYVRFIVL